MSYASTRDRYLENEILSRPSEWLVPLLYEHLLSSLTRAAIHIEQNDYEGKAKSLQKATAIVLELSATLDLENGGEIAGRLANLYAFFVGEIMDIGRKLDLERLERLTGLVSELHEAWVDAAEQVAPRRGAERVALAS